LKVAELSAHDQYASLLYVPFAFLVGTVSASVATRIWRRTWRALAHEEKVHHDRSWLEIFAPVEHEPTTGAGERDRSPLDQRGRSHRMSSLESRL
jgi:hypothetical protein